MFQNWRTWAARIRAEAHAVYLASLDSRVPCHARLLAVAVLGYLFSPIDLIPDFIPVLGLVDDLLIVPAGLLLVIRLIPPAIMDEHRRTARVAAERAPRSWIAALVIAGVWLAVLCLVVRVLMPRF